MKFNNASSTICAPFLFMAFFAILTCLIALEEKEKPALPLPLAYTTGWQYETPKDQQKRLKLYQKFVGIASHSNENINDSSPSSASPPQSSSLCTGFGLETPKDQQNRKKLLHKLMSNEKRKEQKRNQKKVFAIPPAL
uniref:Uncharacterized protein n=1 Tax=Globodera pallida TaxID=36090 RepID=A0A183BSJ9_GLOPA